MVATDTRLADSLCFGSIEKTPLGFRRTKIASQTLADAGIIDGRVKRYRIPDVTVKRSPWLELRIFDIRHANPWRARGQNLRRMIRIGFGMLRSNCAMPWKH